MKSKPSIIKTNAISKFVIPMTSSPIHNHPEKFFDHSDDIETGSDNGVNNTNHIGFFCLSINGVAEDFRGLVMNIMIIAIIIYEFLYINIFIIIIKELFQKKQI